MQDILRDPCIIIGSMMLIVEGKVLEDNRLTTAIKRGTASAEPTTLFRRIYVGKTSQSPYIPLDLFRLQDHKLRSRLDLWDWDFLCQLQPKMGNCTENINRYYYDAQLDQCMTFTYTGCFGNNNNFKTLFDCDRHCKGASYMPIKELKRSIFCALQPDSGMCLAYVPQFLYFANDLTITLMVNDHLYIRYHFDVNEDDCKRFIYGGCGGNQNRFNSINECRRQCQNKKFT